MNKVCLSGHLVKEIELKQTQNGKSVTSNRIAVSRDMKDKDGNYITDFINFVAWERQAEYLSKYATKGDRIEIVGRWQTRTYEDKNGQTQTANEVLVENINVFSKKPKEEPTESNSNTDDLPF